MKRKFAIVDERISEGMASALTRLGFTVIALPRDDRLPDPMRSHTDMLIARLGEDYITTVGYYERAPFVISDIYDNIRPRMHFADEEVGGVYPSDALLNILYMGDRIYARESSLSEYIKRLAGERGIKILNVNQGYPACTVLKLSDEAVITADSGMAAALERDGVRVYKIKDGGISLPPYPYGFIGGAAGVLDGAVYFLGNVEAHPSYDIIKYALEGEGLRPISLSTEGLVDLGGLYLTEAYI